MTKKKSNFHTSDLKEMAMKVSAIALGAFVGAQAKAMLAKKDAVSGTDLLGLGGTASSYLVPGLIVAAGAIGSKMMSNPFMKDMCVGISVSGGVSLINTVAGKNVISLNGTDEATPSLMLPGINGAVNEDGDEVVYIPTNAPANGVELPDENEAATTFVPEGEPKSELNMEDGTTEGVGEILL